MRADALAYQRATSVSLVGLIIQAALTLALFVYGLFGQDALARTAFWIALTGVPAWTALLLLFHQHKLERLEAAEAEMLEAGGGAEASVFRDAAEDLRVAARRLRWMHTYLSPAFSLVIAAALLLVGWMRLRAGRSASSIDTFAMPAHTGWAIAVGLGVAVIGFIFARFVAGMAQQKVWQNLRAGAVYAVGASLYGLVLAVSHGVAFLGSEALYRVLLVVAPALMLVLGAEILLNFILNVYRPRKAGETPRPAFESRLLGFVSAPDRIAESISDAINYQFGWNVSATWFYQLLSRSFLGLVVLAGLMLWLLTSLAVVRPNETGLILRFGQVARQVDSGLHLKRPWPLETVETYPALRVSELTIGTEAHDHDHDDDDDAPLLWTSSHGDERLTIVQPASFVSADRFERDVSLLAIEVSVQYEVVDLLSYKLLAADARDPDDPDRRRRELLEAVASRELVRFASSRTVSEILGPEREALNRELAASIQAAFARLGRTDPETGQNRGAGVEVLFVGIANAHPPAAEGVAASFEGVVSAEQEREALLEQAQTNAIQTLATVAGDVELARRIDSQILALQNLQDTGAAPETIELKEQEIQDLLEQAGGDAAALIASARSERWRRHMDARGRAIRHDGRVGLFRAAPQAYMARQYFETISQAVSDTRLFITAFERPFLRLNFEELEGNLADPFAVPQAKGD